VSHRRGAPPDHRCQAPRTLSPRRPAVLRREHHGEGTAHHLRRRDLPQNTTAAHPIPAPNNLFGLGFSLFLDELLPKKRSLSVGIARAVPQTEPLRRPRLRRVRRNHSGERASTARRCQCPTYPHKGSDSMTFLRHQDTCCQDHRDPVSLPSPGSQCLAASLSSRAFASFIRRVAHATSLSSAARALARGPGSDILLRLWRASSSTKPQR
jgi:hypothetical protein